MKEILISDREPEMPVYNSKYFKTLASEFLQSLTLQMTILKSLLARVNFFMVNSKSF